VKGRRFIRCALASVGLALTVHVFTSPAANASEISCDLQAHQCTQVYALADGSVLQALYGYDNRGGWWIITLIHSPN
jgi:hypothetical protein